MCASSIYLHIHIHLHGLIESTSKSVGKSLEKATKVTVVDQGEDDEIPIYYIFPTFIACILLGPFADE